MILVDASVLLHAYEPRSAHHNLPQLVEPGVFRRGARLPRLGHDPGLPPDHHEPGGSSRRRSRRPRPRTSSPRGWRSRPSSSSRPASGAGSCCARCWSRAGASGAHVTHAFLAALALENGATLVTTDRDFTRFPKLQLRRPDGRLSHGLSRSPLAPDSSSSALHQPPAGRIRFSPRVRRPTCSARPRVAPRRHDAAVAQWRRSSHRDASGRRRSRR